jgi:hypothetical protein
VFNFARNVGFLFSSELTVRKIHREVAEINAVLNVFPQITVSSGECGVERNRDYVTAVQNN